jgi:recombination DNA repair RAD52 pathway protein
MSQFNGEQTVQLLAPIHPKRVLTANGQSHLSQQDVIAHLIRVFGFGGFDVTHPHGPPQVIFEDEKVDGQGKSRWTVAYRAFVRLDVKDEYGRIVASYEEGSTGDARNQPARSDAHDLAMKSALSLAKKRAAIHLGDQFGLSLYNKGQKAALVLGTKVVPAGYEGRSDDGDLQDNVPQQEALGIDETHYSGTDHQEEMSDEQKEMLQQSVGLKEGESVDTETGEISGQPNPANTPDDAHDVGDSVPQHTDGPNAKLNDPLGAHHSQTGPTEIDR